MNLPARSLPELDAANALESEVDEAIALCGGDVRAALRVTLVANAFLERELERLSAAVSTGFDRGRVRRPPRRQKIRLVTRG
jgi:hypothetical protein